MRGLLLAFLLLFLLLGGYLAYAYFFEGEKVDKILIKGENKEIILQEQRNEGQKMAQGLPAGKYAVWSQRQEDKNGSSKVSLWRFYLPNGKPKNFG